MGVDKVTVAGGVRKGQNLVVTGEVLLGDFVSLWHNVVVRGDVEPIRIGKETNIQDNTVIHGQLGLFDVTIGEKVSVGHNCIIHGCEIGSYSFIGMGSIIMNGVRLGERVFVAAGSLVPENYSFEEKNTLLMGRPAKPIRKLREKEVEIMLDTPRRYVEYAKKWLSPF